MKIESKVKEIVSSILQCKIEDLNETSGLLTQYNWDSLNHISIITEIELNFDIVIPDEKIIELNNIKSLIQYINEVKNELL